MSHRMFDHELPRTCFMPIWAPVNHNSIVAFRSRIRLVMNLLKRRGLTLPAHGHFDKRNLLRSLQHRLFTEEKNPIRHSTRRVSGDTRVLDKAETLRRLRQAMKGKNRRMGHLSDVHIEKVSMDERGFLYLTPKHPGIFYHAEPVESFGTDDVKHIISHIQKRGVS